MPSDRIAGGTVIAPGSPEAWPGGRPGAVAVGPARPAVLPGPAQLAAAPGVGVRLAPASRVEAPWRAGWPWMAAGIWDSPPWFGVDGWGGRRTAHIRRGWLRRGRRIVVDGDPEDNQADDGGCRRQQGEHERERRPGQPGHRELVRHVGDHR